MMKPVPPMTWGAQYAPSTARGEREDWMAGRAVNPAIQKMVAAMYCAKHARKPISRR